MTDIEIYAFEKQIIDFCNHINIPNRVKYYVMKDITQKLLVASEQEIVRATKELEKRKENSDELH